MGVDRLRRHAPLVLVPMPQPLLLRRPGLHRRRAASNPVTRQAPVAATRYILPEIEQ